MDTKLFETTEGKLVWSATSQSYEPKTTSDVIKSVTYIVVNQLYAEDYIHWILDNLLIQQVVKKNDVQLNLLY